MNIIIVGAGKIGTTILERLLAENHDIVVIDSDPKVIAKIRYTNKNIPPPYFAARYGNLHIFPSPTAEPAAARTNPILLVKLLRSFIYINPPYLNP